MHRLAAYSRIGLAVVVLLFVSVACSEKTGKTPEQKVSQQQSFALPQETNDLEISVEQTKKDNGVVKVDGWSAVKKLDSKDSTIYCILKSKDKVYIFDTFQPYKRPDVTAYSKIDRDESGFNVVIPADKLEKGEYQIGVLIKKNNVDHVQFTDKKLTTK